MRVERKTLSLLGVGTWIRGVLRGGRRRRQSCRSPTPPTPNDRYAICLSFSIRYYGTFQVSDSGTIRYVPTSSSTCLRRLSRNTLHRNLALKPAPRSILKTPTTRILNCSCRITLQPASWKLSTTRTASSAGCARTSAYCRCVSATCARPEKRERETRVDTLRE